MKITEIKALIYGLAFFIIFKIDKPTNQNKIHDLTILFVSCIILIVLVKYKVKFYKVFVFIYPIFLSLILTKSLVLCIPLYLMIMANKIEFIFEKLKT